MVAEEVFWWDYSLLIYTISIYLLNFKKAENNEYQKQMLSFGVLREILT
jgi:hypothetical protein